MKKTLLDVNVLLDVLQQREPHYASSARVLSLCEEGKLKGYVAAQSYGILHYILRQELSSDQTAACLNKIRRITKIISLDEKIIDLSLNCDFDDFEDALQHYCAVRNGLKYIITRNKKDFAKSKLIVATPEEFLAMLKG